MSQENIELVRRGVEYFMQTGEPLLVWSLRNSRASSMDMYRIRDDAFKAVGLEE